ncbi:hypothetical protein P4S73_18075 [Paraglaciecola sp. Hal342]
MLFNIRFILLLSLPVFISACVSRPPAPSDTNTEVVVETSVEHNQVKDVSNAGNGAGPKIKQQQTSSKESASQKTLKIHALHRIKAQQMSNHYACKRHGSLMHQPLMANCFMSLQATANKVIYRT